jgi:hypothetical protein
VAFEIRMLDGMKSEMTVNSTKKTTKLIKASLTTRNVQILGMKKNIRELIRCHALFPFEYFYRHTISQYTPSQ